MIQLYTQFYKDEKSNFYNFRNLAALAELSTMTKQCKLTKFFSFEIRSKSATFHCIQSTQTAVVRSPQTENYAADLPDQLSRLYHRDFEQIFPRSQLHMCI